jgi:exonuclease III
MDNNHCSTGGPGDNSQPAPQNCVNVIPREPFNGDKSKTDNHVNPGILRCLLLNVCGLSSKLKGVEFTNCISEYDVVMLTETKLSDKSPNDINIPGYKFLPKNRKNARAASGGVAVLIKDSLTEYFEPQDGNCEFVLWLKGKVQPERETLMGIVYIPPEGTKYSDIQMFDDLESDIISLTSGKDRSVMLFGDFNSRTSCLTDCISIDDVICSAIEFSDEIRQELFDEHVTSLKPIEPQRYSQDKVCDNYGKRLLNLCKELGLYILNGRVGSDKSIGHTTCKGVSVVDYVITTADVFHYASSFHIIPFDPMLSDVHNPVAVSFSTPNKEVIYKEKEPINPVSTKEKLDSIPKRPKWKPDLRPNFIENINIDKITEVENKLTVMESSPHGITGEDVNNISNLICNIVNNSAIETGFVVERSIKNANRKPYKRKLPTKPWFNKNCEAVRKAYHVEKNVYNLTRPRKIKKGSKLLVKSTRAK